MITKNKHSEARSIGRFTALKTAIANGDESSVKDLLPNEPMIEIEKSYLIELAELNGHPGVLNLLKEAPVKK